jgi:hypothetical protein
VEREHLGNNLMIDIKAFGRHFKSVPKRVQHMKFVYDLQPLEAHQVKVHGSMKNELMHQCPCCHAALETQTHMLQCIHNPARSKALMAFRTEIRKGDGTQFLKVLFGEMWWSNGWPFQIQFHVFPITSIPSFDTTHSQLTT